MSTCAWHSRRSQTTTAAAIEQKTTMIARRRPALQAGHQLTTVQHVSASGHTGLQDKRVLLSFVCVLHKNHE